MSIEKLASNGINIIGDTVQKTSPKTSAATEVIQGGKERLALIQKALAAQGAAVVKTLKLNYDEPNKINIVNTEIFQKAKNYVMQSILCDTPKESMVIIQNGKIISSCEGTFDSVDFADDISELINKKGQNFVVVHSHPKLKHQMTNPVSFGDYETLARYQGIDSIYAINNKGEYSGLKKISERIQEFSDSTTATNKIEEYKNKYWQEFQEILDDKTRKEYLHLREKIQNPSSIMDYINASKDFDAFLLRIQEENKSLVKFVHDFWQKYASELGLKYETNYGLLS